MTEPKDTVFSERIDERVWLGRLTDTPMMTAFKPASVSLAKRVKIPFALFSGIIYFTFHGFPRYTGRLYSRNRPNPTNESFSQLMSCTGGCQTRCLWASLGFSSFSNAEQVNMPLRSSTLPITLPATYSGYSRSILKSANSHV